MSPKKGPSSKNNNPPSPPPSQFDPVMFHLAVSAAVTATMKLLYPDRFDGPRYNPYPQNHENVQEHQNERNECNMVILKKRKGQSSQGPSMRHEIVAVQAATTPVVVSTVQAPSTRYAGNLPWCNKCKYHRYTPGPCLEKICINCGKRGHLA